MLIYQINRVIESVNKLSKNNKFWIIPVLLVMGIIFYSSATPYGDQDLRPSLMSYLPLDAMKPVLEPIDFMYHGKPVNLASHGPAGLVEFLIRKAAHVTVFLLLMVTSFLALHKLTSLRLLPKLGAAFVITVLYASFDEFHQSLTPDRTPYIGDVVLDSFGGLIGALLILVIWRFGKRA
ncbi:VanZ family protein [Bacillus sp. SB49]|nr:VanZ family protein [Bacillus sp. SB49]